MKNKIEDLRGHLFEVIERLKSNSDPDASEKDKINIEDAKVIADIGKVLVESAKVEVAFMKETGAKGSGFIPEDPNKTEPKQLQ